MYSRDSDRDDDCGREERRDKILWGDRPEHERSDRRAPRRDCQAKPATLAKSGLLEDSDTLIILALIMLLMREKADSKLIFVLLLVIL